MLEQLGQDLLDELKVSAQRATGEPTLSGFAMTSCFESAAQYMTSGQGCGSSERKLGHVSDVLGQLNSGGVAHSYSFCRKLACLVPPAAMSVNRHPAATWPIPRTGSTERDWSCDGVRSEYVGGDKRRLSRNK